MTRRQFFALLSAVLTAACVGTPATDAVPDWVGGGSVPWYIWERSNHWQSEKDWVRLPKEYKTAAECWGVIDTLNNAETDKIGGKVWVCSDWESFRK